MRNERRPVMPVRVRVLGMPVEVAILQALLTSRGTKCTQGQNRWYDDKAHDYAFYEWS
jgi:hypothetical protein